MGRFTIILVAIALIAVFGEAKHVNRHLIESQDIITVVSHTEPVESLIETTPKFRSDGFVPMNNVLFFKRFPPCEAGFKRDILGVCREVW